MLEISTQEEFITQVLQAQVPVLVDFWAPWCGPCRMMAPVVEQLTTTYKGPLVVAKVNVDQLQTVASEYGISSIPTLILFVQGQIVAQSVGARDLASLDHWLTSKLSSQSA